MKQPSPAGLQAAWQPGPSRPRLPEGVVHVWKADLAAADERLAALLSEQEQARAARLLSQRDRVYWTRSRGLLRALLGRYLSTDPTALRFTAGAHGKPALDASDASEASVATTPGAIELSSLSFNLSHSSTLAVYAFSRAPAVGVDVEADRRAIDEVALAERLLDEPVAARLRALADPGLRRREFLRAWTRHEAKLKCLGTGIGAGAELDEHTLWVTDLEPGDGAAAAIACEREPHELSCWTWDGQP